jgi:hypothetical protein
MMCRVQDPCPYLQGQGHTYNLKDVHIPVWTVTLLFIEGFLNNLAQVSTTSRQCFAAKAHITTLKVKVTLRG